MRNIFEVALKTFFAIHILREYELYIFFYDNQLSSVFECQTVFFPLEEIIFRLFGCCSRLKQKKNKTPPPLTKLFLKHNESRANFEIRLSTHYMN